MAGTRQQAFGYLPVTKEKAGTMQTTLRILRHNPETDEKPQNISIKLDALPFGQTLHCYPAEEEAAA